MARAFTSFERAAWRRRFLAGAGRSGEPPSTLPPLAALALAAQRDRFERPAGAGLVDFGGAAEDPRPILPEAARAPFRRLLRQKNAQAGQLLVRSAFRALGAAGVRPHPFDLPLAEPWMGQIESLLGPAERAYRGRLGGSPVPSPTGPTWEDLTPARRVEAARDQRQADPAAGRALIAERLAEEAAATRANLVEALAVGLGPDDRELLTSLLADRAQSVRAAVQDLLARIPGADAYAKRLDAAVEVCLLKKVGIFGGRRKLVLIAGPKTTHPVHRVLEVFSGVRLSDLAMRLDAKMEELLTETDDPLPALALAVCGLAEGRTDVFARLGRALAEYDAPFLAMRLKPLFDDMEPTARSAALSGYIAVAPPQALYDLPSWAMLLATLDHPLSVETARRLMRSEAAEAAVAGADDQKARTTADALTGLSAAIPRACAADLCALLAPLGPQAGPARDFAEFLSALP